VPQPGQVTILLSTDRLESFLRRCKRLGFCDVDTQTVVERFQYADEILFERVLNDDDMCYTHSYLQRLNTATVS